MKGEGSTELRLIGGSIRHVVGRLLPISSSLKILKCQKFWWVPSSVGSPSVGVQPFINNLRDNI